MRSSSCLFVQAGNYNKLLNDNITSSYAKQNDELKATIDAEAKEVAGKLGIADRAELFVAKQDAYISLKHHKTFKTILNVV